jgi:hypothetical protein
VSSTVWKYPLEIADEQTITVPADPRVLHLGMQYGQPCLWILVNPEKEPIEMVIRILGTGWAPVETLLWVPLGTVMQKDGRLVWHFFWDRSPFQ